MIADPRAERVVDLAEPVEIEAQQSRGLAMPAPGQGLRQPLAELAPVRQPGHRVVRGEMPDLGLGDRGAGHVGAAAAEPDQLPGAVLDRPAGDLQMALAAVDVGDPDREVLEAAAAHQVGAVAHPGVVVDQGAARPPGRARLGQLDQRRRRIVRHLDKMLVGIDLPGPLRARGAVLGRAGGLLGGAVGELDQPALGLLPAARLGAELARAPVGDHAEPDRHRDQERPELAEQPAPAVARQLGEQPLDIDERAERGRAAEQDQDPHQIVPSGRAAKEPEPAGSEVGHGLGWEHGLPPKAGASSSVSAPRANKGCMAGEPGAGDGTASQKEGETEP